MVSTRGKKITYHEDIDLDDLGEASDVEAGEPSPKRRKKMQEEEYCYTSKIRRRKKKDDGKGESTQGSSKPLPRPTGKPGRKLHGKLASLMNMPLEIFSEICSHLFPPDLLNLARSSKRLRDILMTKSAKPMWRDARVKQVPGLPECPTDLSEPQYAALIFTTVCQGCTGLRAVRVHYGLRTRHCIRCYSDHVIRFEHLSTLNLPITEALDIRLYAPNVRANEPGKAYSQSFTWFSKETLRILDRMWSALGDPDARATFKDQQTAAVENIEKHGEELDAWQAKQDAELEREGDEIRATRLKAIKEKLLDLGYETTDFPVHRYDEKAREWFQLTERRQPLTDKVWNNLRPKLVEVLDVIKARRLEQEQEQERNSRREQRKIAVADLWRSFRSNNGSSHPDIFLPELGYRVMELAAVKELIHDDTNGGVITAERWESQVPAVLDELALVTGNIERAFSVWYSRNLSNLADIDPPTSISDDGPNPVNNTQPTSGGGLVDMRLATSVFACNICNEALWIPSAFRHAHFEGPFTDLGQSDWDSLFGPFCTRFIPSLRQTVSSILGHLQLDPPNVKSTDLPVVSNESNAEPGSLTMYFCMLCDENIRKPMSFTKLIRHMHDEMKTYEKGRRQIDEDGAEAFWNPRAQIPDFLKDHDLEVEPGLDRVLMAPTEQELTEQKMRFERYSEKCSTYSDGNLRPLTSKYWRGSGSMSSCALCPSYIGDIHLQICSVVSHLKTRHGVDIASKVEVRRNMLRKMRGRSRTVKTDPSASDESDVMGGDGNGMEVDELDDSGVD